MSQNVYIACDLGAESGRVMAGTLNGATLALEELYRFRTPTVTDRGSLHWNVFAIWEGICTGLKIAAGRFGAKVRGISVDAWGVDYVLLDRNGQHIGKPFHYRDPRTAGIYPRVRQEIGDARIFEQTGVQFLSINTLYQLCADDLSTISDSDVMLMMGDYFNFRLSGVPVVEQSSASTTQLYNPRTRAWSEQLIADCGLPRNLFPKIVPSGTVLAPIQADLADHLGWRGEPPRVVATCTHDTGAAVVATPADDGRGWAFLSSGTWSLLGVELAEPLINDRVRAVNFTNEAGYGGTTRFLKNITGLWLLQELRRAWGASGQELDYASLMQQAEASEPFRSLIDLNLPRFSETGGMAERIVAFCRSSGQAVPRSVGEFVRCVLESLALQYQQVLNEAEELVGFPIDRVHVVGGGSQSELLNQFTANATGRTVIAGPIEATAAGNVLIQALALGDIDSLAQARKIIRESFPTRAFAPQNRPAWKQAVERYSALREASA